MGTKFDLVKEDESMRQVKEEEALDFCEKNNILWYGEYSSKETDQETFQKLFTEFAKKIYEKVGKLVEKWGEELIGENGYSSVAAVVGATYPTQLKELRQLMPHTFFLIPGYGAQGGKAEDIALAFDKNGLGGIINASRSLMCAYKSDRWKDKYTEEQYAEATRAEALRMRDELNSAINKNI